jgi:hypothetical protein
MRYYITSFLRRVMLSFPKFDLFQQPEYLRAQAHAAEYATSPPIINHYGRYI